MNKDAGPIRIHTDESYQSWSERVAAYEQARALGRIKSGEDINIVLREFSERLNNKLLHPIMSIINQASVPSEEDMRASRQSYEENYQRYYSGKADHVSDD